MSLRQSRRQLYHISNFGFLDFRACHLSLRLINKTGGSFSFSPPCLLASSSSLHRPDPHARPSSSSSALDLISGRCINLIVPEKRGAPSLLRQQQ